MDKRLLKGLQREIEHQCRCVQLGFEALDIDMRDQMRSHSDRYDRIWFDVQNIVTASARLSRLLWGGEDRAKLRAKVGVDDSSPLRLTAVRNHIEHIDERFERWARESPDHGYYDRNLRSVESIKTDKVVQQFRNLDPDMVVTFMGDRYPLLDIRAEVDRICPIRRPLD
jgi:hypothetical protein